MKFIRLTNTKNNIKELVNVQHITRIKPGVESNSVADCTTLYFGEMAVVVREDEDTVLDLIRKVTEIASTAK